MALIPPLRDRTLHLSDRVLEEREAATPERPYLGMSAIGAQCARRLWYRFRFVRRVPFKSKTLKKFRDGHSAEAMVVRQLQQCDWLQVIAEDENGEQRAYVDFGGHFRGHQDGEITGIVEAPKTTHCLEVKATEHFQELIDACDQYGEKDALRHWNAEYYAQAQMYMFYGGYTRHFLVVTTPGGREWTSVRTDFNKSVAIGLRDRAEFIIFTEQPPTRMCPKAEHYEAHWCEFAPVCFGDPTTAGRNCRTCLHVTPERDGDWSCRARNGDPLTVAEQRQGCSLHRYHPGLLHDREPRDVSGEGSNLIVAYTLADGSPWIDEGGEQ
jgi:hypothetical protein